MNLEDNEERTKPWRQVVAMVEELHIGDPEGDSGRMQYVPEGWYPVYAPRAVIAPPRVGHAPGLTPEERAQAVRDYGEYSPRQLARRYGVSYETIRRAVAVGAVLPKDRRAGALWAR